MFTITTSAQAKKSATALRKALAARGIEVTRSAAYEVLAKMAGCADWNAMAATLRLADNASTAAAQSKEGFAIADVPFAQICAVRDGENYYDVHSLEEEVLRWLGDWNNSANPYRDDPTVTAIHLTWENEGLVYDSELSADTLLGLKWDKEKKVFIAADGDRVTFYFRIPFGQHEGVGEKAPGCSNEVTQLEGSADSDPMFDRSDEIKREYLASGCSRRDADRAIQDLLNECGELFENADQAWEFLAE